MGILNLNPSTLISAVVSATISAVIAVVVGTLLDSRLKRRFEKEIASIRHTQELETEKLRHAHEVDLERIKAQLSVRTDTAKEVMERSLAINSKVAELVYRIRNIAREISKQKEPNKVLVAELLARAQELDETIYTYRLDLERVEVFANVHTYKNITKTFVGFIKDRMEFQKRKEFEKAEEVNVQLQNSYSELEKNYQPIIDKLSKQFTILPFPSEESHE